MLIITKRAIIGEPRLLFRNRESYENTRPTGAAMAGFLVTLWKVLPYELREVMESNIGQRARRDIRGH